MDYHIVGIISWLLIVIATTCTKQVNIIEASLILNSPEQRTSGGSSSASNNLGAIEHASYISRSNGEFFGVQAKLNIWSPNTNPGDFSAAGITIAKSHLPRMVEISAGWMVNPKVFNSMHPRIFASYTIDDEETCFNYEPNCKAFIKKEPRFYPFTEISVHGGPQYDVDVKIIKDKDSKKWRLIVNNTELGYWRENIVLELENGGNIVGWGGQVYISHNSQNPPAMGSGKFPEEGYGKASYIKQVQYFNKDHVVKNPINLESIVTNHTRYKVGHFIHRASEPIHFFYGGPGHPS